MTYLKICFRPMCARVPRQLVLTPLLICLFAFMWCPQSASGGAGTAGEKGSYDRFEVLVKRFYRDLGLRRHGLNFDVFRYALIGYYNLLKSHQIKRPGILSIVDFSRPSSEERLYVIDLKTKNLLYRSLVAHGMGTGNLYARRFSNTPNSKKSSLGFFVTSNTYHGKHGYSLRLDGKEKGFNDRARRRAIVMHGADYVSRRFAERSGRIGRSWGCPAVPVGFHQRIIDAIKGGTCLFQYGSQPSYLKGSALLKLPQAVLSFALENRPQTAG